ncbi:ATP-binding protein, partial [bacterium]|nr:ATP-binding protein [bacterium]
MSTPVNKYNPSFLSDDELADRFVVRHADLKLVVDTVRENTTRSNQHVLVVGPRGIGKTMLVQRVAAAVRSDPDLSERWYPLSYAEESYEVLTPGEFWLEALFHLGQQTGDGRWHAIYDDLKKNELDEARLRQRALGHLMEFAEAQGKRILLLVENACQLFTQQIDKDDAWVIRDTLQNEPRIMLLASAVSRFEDIESEGRAMYDLFRVQELAPLDTAECTTVWNAITGQDAEPRRIRPIEILTGGNPRLLVVISSFAANRSLRNLMENLVQLVDDHTDYFKSHLDVLPPHERKVFA